MPLPRPSSFDDLMRWQHVAAVNVSGADHSCWNGRIDETGPAEDGWVVLGAVTWDNTIRYHQDLVVKPLRELFEHAGEQQDVKALLRYRHALGVMFHENAHLLAAAGTDHKGSQSIYQVSPAIRALDEGTREAFSHRNLDRYIDELQLAEVAPGIKDVVCPTKYPNFTPATQAVAHRLGQASGLGSNEVLRRLAVVTPSVQWPVAARIMMQANGLDRLLPDRAGLVARSEIEAAMRRQFARLDTLADGPLLSVRAKSVMVGNETFEAGRKVADRIRRQYGDVAGAALSGVVPLQNVHKIAPGNHGERAGRGDAGERAPEAER